jgi:hypothetical protein
MNEDLMLQYDSGQLEHLKHKQTDMSKIITFRAKDPKKLEQRSLLLYGERGQSKYLNQLLELDKKHKLIEKYENK